MKTRTFFKTLSLALLTPLCLGAIHAEDDTAPAEPEKTKVSKGKKEKKGSKAKDPDNYISNNIPAWANPDGAQRSLIGNITNTLKGNSPEQVIKFVESPRNRLLIAQYMLAQYDKMTPVSHIEKNRKKLTDTINKLPGEIERDKETLKTMRGKERVAFQAAIKAKQDSIKRLEAELKNTPWTLKELATHRDGKTVLKNVTSNLKWMEEFCFSGPCVAPGRALHIIAAIAKKYPEVYKEDGVERGVATAVGIEWARYGWDFDKAMIRADYYIEKWREGRLNVLFDTLPMYLRRIVCGCRGDIIAGDRKSLEWALDNVHVPAESYMGAPHRMDYRLTSLYGCSIHDGDNYYGPWEHLYGGNHFTKSLFVGGVCGAISHFGAYSAVANGVPSLTCGEPGHCAYVLWVDGTWTPGNTVSWERGLHWQPVLEMYGAYSSLHLGSELYMKLEKDTHISNVYRVLAHNAINTNKDKLAISYFQDAASAQPINIPVWQEYNNYLATAKAGDMKLLSELHDNLCFAVAPRYPEVVSEFLGNWVYPKMIAAKMPGKDMMPRFHAFWDNVRDMGPERWRIEKFGRRMIEMLAYQPPPEGKEIPPPNPKNALPVYQLMMSNLASKGDYLPVVIGWGEELTASIGGAAGKAFVQIIKDLSKTGTGAMGGGDNTKVTGQLMLAAARARDIATFQRLGANSASLIAPQDIPEFDPPANGKLLSEEGLLITSSTSSHDAPVDHWGVLRPIGGRFHTEKDENAWAAVMLPRPAYANCVVIVTTGGNHHRLNNMVIQVSDDGQNWQSVSKDLGNCTQRVIKVEFPEALGRYVRILRKGGPEFFHLNGIYIYGRFAA